MKIKQGNKNLLYAIATIVGYVVGVGMFGLPFLISKAGLGVFFAFLIFFGAVQYLLHLIYANIIVVTKEYHRLAGYTEIYFGKRGKHLVAFAKLTGNISGLLAYIIITGIFLNDLLFPVFGGNPFIYSSVLFFLEAAIVFFGIKTIARFELMMSFLLLLVIVLISIKGYGAIELSNFKGIDWKYALIPYGAMLMALDGGGSLPIVAKLLRRDKKKIKKAVFWGSFIPVLVIMIFTLVIVGISGASTSPDALSGIRAILDDGVVFFSLIFGVLTMVTSFLLVSESVKETLWWDYKMNKNLAWALAVFIPYFFFLLGIKDLAKVISFAGGIGGSLCAIVLVMIFFKLKKQKDKLPLFKFKPGNLIVYFLVSLFLIGFFYEIYYFLLR